VLHDLHSSPNIISVIKSIMMRRARRVARVEKNRGAYAVLVGKPKGMKTIGNVDGRIIVKWILKEIGWGLRLD
jgi:hypothetical protein